MTSPQNDAPGSSQLGRSASQLGEKIQETAGQMAESQLSKQKQTATGTLQQLVEALRMTGDHLRASHQERVAGYAQQASDQVRRFSESIRGAQPRDILQRVEDVARREPALFLGGAFVLGLIGARFLKSSERSPNAGRDGPRLPPLDGPEAVEPYSSSRVGAGSSGGREEAGELGVGSDEPSAAAREH